MNSNERTAGGAAFFVVVAAWVAAIVGCAPQVLPPTPHAAISPSQVNLYQKPPAKYEAIATIALPVTAEMRWDERGDSTAGFDAFKARAAAMGANGVLLQGDPGSFDMLVTAGYKGTWYQVPARGNPKTIVARAIYVVTE